MLLFEQYLLAESKEDFIKNLIPDSQDSLYFQVVYALNNKKQLSQDDLKNLQKLKQNYPENSGYKLCPLDFQHLIRLLDSNESSTSEKEKAIQDLRNYFPLTFNVQKPESSQLQSIQISSEAQQSQVGAQRHSNSILDENILSFENYLNKSYLDLYTFSNIQSKYVHYMDIKRLLKESKSSQYYLEILKAFVQSVQHAHSLKDLPLVYKAIYDECKSRNEVFDIGNTNLNQLSLSQLQELGKISHDNLFQTIEYQTQLMIRLFYKEFQQFQDKKNSELTHNQKKEKKQCYIKVLEWTKKNLPSKFQFLLIQIKQEILVLNLELEEFEKDRFLEYVEHPLQILENNNQEIDVENDSESYELLLRLFCFSKINNKKLTETIQKYLIHFFENAQSIKPYDSYFDEHYLNNIYYTSKISSGQQEYITKCTHILNETEIKNLLESRSITILDTNNKYIKSSDEVKLLVETKNIQNLTINVFEIKTEKYYLDKSDQFDNKFNTDGLIPVHKYEYSYNDPPNKIVKRSFSFDHLSQCKRGYFIIDFFGNTISSRAAFQKGKLDIIKVPTIAGLMITILDEDKNICKQSGDEKTGIWFQERFYDVNNDGHIIIPYQENYQSDNAIAVHDGLSQLFQLSVQSEQYGFQCNFLYNQESFIQGNKAKIIIHPTLVLNGLPANMKLIQDQMVQVNLVNHQDIPQQLEFRDIVFEETKDIEIQIPVQSILKSINITVSGVIHKMNGKKQELKIQNYIKFELRKEPENQIYDVNLKKTELGYVIFAIDKSGKQMENIPVDCTFKYKKLSNTTNTVSLETDKEGKIVLGELKDISVIECVMKGFQNFPESFSRWNLLNTCDNCIPEQLFMIEGEILEIPLPSHITLNNNQIAFYSQSCISDDIFFMEDMFNKLHLDQQILRISNLKQGSYELDIEDYGHINVIVYKGTYWKYSPHYIATDDKLVFVQKKNTQLARIKGVEFIQTSDKDSGLLVNLNLPQDLTEKQIKELRVHVFGYNFLSNYNLDQVSKIKNHECDFYLEDISFQQEPATFLNNKKIGDEICYVYNRKNQTKRIGNTLEKPCMLLKRTFNQDTKFDAEELAEGKEYAEMCYADCYDGGGGGGGGENVRCMRRQITKQHYMKKEIDTFLNFLKYPSFISSNNSVAQDGSTFIKGFQSDKYSCVQVIVTGYLFGISEIFPTKQMNTITQDLRHQSSLKLDEFYTENFSCGKLIQNQSIQISADSQFAIISSIPELFEAQKQVMQTGRNSDTYYDLSYNTWNFLKEWNSFTDYQKLEKYNEFAGHQLNLFLYFKDPKFFSLVVEPFIQNKIQKTFIDYFLLKDLTQQIKYDNSERIKELNILERSLLVLSLVNANQKERAQQIVNSLQGQNKTVVEDIHLQKRLYKTIIEQKKQESKELVATSDCLAFEQRICNDDEYEKRDENVKRSKKCVDRKEMSHRSLMQEESDGLMEQRKKFQEGYKKLEKTVEYKERQYYGKKEIDENSSNLIQINKFWIDLVEHIMKNNGIQNFVSDNFVLAFNNHIEALGVIAVMDLSFSSSENFDIQSQSGRKISVSALRNIIYFSQEIAQSKDITKSNIGIIQTFFDPHDLYTTMKDDPTIQIEKSVDEFLINKIYGCKVIISNISMAKYNISTLFEIPNGAIPVNSFEYTKSIDLSLSAYQTNNSIQFYFYFPQSGNFSIYRSNASRNGTIVSQAQEIQPFVVKLKRDIKKMENLSDILINGSKEDILNFAKTSNLYDNKQFKIEKILYFLQTDKDFFLKIIQIMKDQRIFDRQVWECSFLHNYVQGVKELLNNQEFRRYYINSEYLKILYHQNGFLDFDNFKVFEYHPLLTQRVHSFMDQNKSKILNVQFKQTYFDYVQYLSHVSNPDGNHYLVLSYYLILQERINEAIQIFNKIKQGDVVNQSKIQYDYFAAYLDIYVGGPNFKKAREICDKYIEYPIISWRNLFINLYNQLLEYDGQALDESELVETNLSRNLNNAEKHEYINIERLGKQLLVQYQNATKAEINFYMIDIEILFSIQPFMEGSESNEFTYIKPNDNIKLQFEKKNSLEKIFVDIPDKFANKNLCIQMISSSHIQNIRYFSSSLKVQMIQTYGQVKVTNEQNNSLQKVYVKCFAKYKDGRIEFYRDGYTDLRGRFDYSLSSSSDVNEVEEFSILISSEEHGSVIKKAKPPTQSGRMETTIQLLSKKK